MLQNHLRISRWVPLVGVVLSLCLAPAAWAQAPNLAEVARKEQERRKTAKPPAKVYTNKDLPESAQNRGAAAPQPAAAAASGQPAAVAPIDESQSTEKPAESADKGESFWRNRMMTAREDLRRNEVFAEALQTRINSLSMDFVNRDDPFQRAKIGEDRDKALAELARVKDEIARGKKGIEDIEEEARKSGVPPGWLR